MEITLSDRARIALDHIPEADQKEADRFFERLKKVPARSRLPGPWISKVPGRENPNLYIGRLGLKFRALFSAENDGIRVLEVVDQDRLSRFGISGNSRP